MLTNEEARTQTLAGIDRVLGLPRLMVGTAARQLLYGQQTFWQQADDATLAKLVAAVPQTDSPHNREELNMTLTAEHEAKLAACPCAPADLAQRMKALPSFNWANLIALLQKDGPTAVAIIQDVLAAFGV